MILEKMLARKEWKFRDFMRSALFTSLLFSVLVAGAANAAEKAMEIKEMEDEAILAAVEYGMLVDRAVFSNDIDLTVVDGIVTLSGSVDNLLSRDRAVGIARAVKGVRSVVDLIEIRPPRIRDSELEQKVKGALLIDPVTEAFEIDVEARDGAVNLSGRVESWAEKRICSRVVKGVEGVKSIENDIVVRYPESRSDAKIKREVLRKLEIDVYLRENDINVQVSGGKVTLKGTVGSAEEKFRAWGSAFVTGVLSVDDSALEVEPQDGLTARRDRPPAAFQLSDESVREAVKDALMFDPRVNSFRPDIHVRNGLVTLRGFVGDLAAKNAAVEDARNTAGVRKVRDFLRVRREVVPPDAVLERDIESALARDPFLDAPDFDVSADAGVIELHGVVDTAFEKARATKVASGVRGVVLVENYIGLRKGNFSEWMDDWELEENIERQIFWSPYVDSDQVSVTVADGVAVLTGEVDSWFERRMAAANARQAGATRVRNKITIPDFSPDLFK